MKEHQLLQRWVQVRLLVAGAIFVYLVPYKIPNYVTKGF